MTEPEPTNAHLMDAIKDLKHDLVSLTRRTTTIENARATARSEYDENWRDVKGRLDDSRTRLERIEYQTTRTNGRVSVLEGTVREIDKGLQALREWKAYMGGIAFSFSWWKAAVAGVVAGVVIYLLTQ